MKQFLASMVSAVALTLLTSIPSHAGDFYDALQSQVSKAGNELSETWTKGNTELYLPLHTHHIRSAYDENRIANYNEKPLGLGVGKGYNDENGNWHGVYAMSFADSHSVPEHVVGYGYLHRIAEYEGFTARLGYTAFLTARSDVAHYLPIPGITPLAGIEKGRLSLMATYIPGGHNYGNIVFVFGKYTLPE